MKTIAATATRGKLSSRLPNSIHVLSVLWPAVCDATMLARVQRGQSGHPSPDALSRTAAPVDMITVLAAMPAIAMRRIETGVGDNTGSVIRRIQLMRGTRP